MDEYKISEDDLAKLGSLHECEDCKKYFPFDDMRHGNFEIKGKSLISHLYCLDCINPVLGIKNFD